VQNGVLPIHLRGKNHLLELMPDAERARLLKQMEFMSVERRTPVFARHETIEYAHFPLSAMISVVTSMSDGETVEVGTVGNEGFAGLALLYDGAEDTNDAFYQIPGETLRMPARQFMAEIAQAGPLRTLILKYAQAFNAQVSQTTACNRLHVVEERLARWILMCQDRVGRTRFELTQEFIAQMLGVRRPTVSLVASTLQKAGFIGYSRGTIDILDRPGLEDASCECYAVVRAEFKRLLS
jgi:CRP-like cAMP-binding protein